MRTMRTMCTTDRAHRYHPNRTMRTMRTMRTTDHAHRYHPNRTMRTMRTKRTICARGGHDAVLAGALEQAGHPGLDKHVRVVHHHRRVRREPQRVQREVSLPSTALGTRQRR